MDIKYRKQIRKYAGFIYGKPLDAYKKYLYKQRVLKDLKLLTEPEKSRVYYLGITEHSNLGDMAQHYCISQWIKNNYPDREILLFPSSTVVNPFYNFPELLKKMYRPDDIIVFQSGYCTQDLGGNHDLMHRIIIETLPNAKILMMPQTIFFQKEANRLRTAKSYNQARKMLFLARDMVSYNQALTMFPDVTVRAFPDIVTTLIGQFNFKHDRNGICLCLRNDGEKYYSNKDLSLLQKDLGKSSNITVTDTTIKANYLEIRKNLQFFIESEIEKFSHYNVTITDRYHGTIFSLAAGTPVIILKTNDHKVVTGADWFKGVYDEYVFVAKDLEDAKRILNTHHFEKLNHDLKPYFFDNYYKDLQKLFHLSSN